MRKRLLTLVPLLASCGLIPLPERTQPDFTFINTLEPGEIRPGMVAYMIQNQMEYLTLPALPYRDMSMDAKLTYLGASGSLRLQVFVAAQRPDCPVVQSRREGYGDALLCPGPGGGQMLAEVVLTPHRAVPVRLEGRVLDQAIRNRQLYLGVRLLEGQTTPDETMHVSEIRINGRL